MSIETMNLGNTIKDEIEAAKDSFRQIRDDIPEEMSGDDAAADVKDVLSKVKAHYIDIYFEEHSKKRLGVADGKRKGEIISSAKLANLKRLKTLSIFSAAKIDVLEKDLAGLKICYELTPDMLKTTHFCTKCNFLMGENEVPVKGKLDAIEDRIDALTDEWTTTLYNTLSDPILEAQTKYLSAQQRTVIDTFIKTKALPEKVDTFFVEAVNTLLEGFEPVAIPADELIDKLDALGPCDVTTFKSRMNDVLGAYTKGKDAEKLRIVVKR